MKTLNFGVDKIKLNLSEEEKKIIEKMKDSGLFEQTLTQALATKYRDGFKGAQQRILGRILDKLDEATDNIVEFEEAEFDLIKGVFLDENTSFNPGQTRLIVQYVKAIELAAKNGEASDK